MAFNSSNNTLLHNSMLSNRQSEDLYLEETLFSTKSILKTSFEESCGNNSHVYPMNVSFNTNPSFSFERSWDTGLNLP
jgi:hypothetical protein